MKCLKPVKTESRIVLCSCTADREACCVTVMTGKKEEIYRVYADTPGEGYTVKKDDATREVNLWNDTCTCEGFQNGYHCRHLRMVKALRNAKRIK